MTLAAKRVALAEGRQLEDLARLLAAEGADVLRCPLLSILDAPNDTPLLAWLDELPSFAYLVLLTGEGLRRLLACAERHGRRDQVIADLATPRTITRGPKPVRALKEIGLAPHLIAPTPTTAGVVEALRALDLHGSTVGVQLYPNSNPQLVEYLTSAGAMVKAVEPYIYAPASDAEHVANLIHRLDEGAIDVLVFTSSPQIDRLFEVASEKNLLPQLSAGLAKTKIAAVGPVVKDALAARLIHAAICPEQGFQMKNLVQHIKRAL